MVTPTLPERTGMLAEAIQSAVAQTVQPYAHLISVDYFHSGPSYHLNALIAAAQTPWIAILPDDDLWDKDHLEKLLSRRRDRDIVYSWGRVIGKHDGGGYRGPFRPKD